MVDSSCKPIVFFPELFYLFCKFVEDFLRISLPIFHLFTEVLKFLVALSLCLAFKLSPHLSFAKLGRGNVGESPEELMTKRPTLSCFFLDVLRQVERVTTVWPLPIKTRPVKANSSVEARSYLTDQARELKTSLPRDLVDMCQSCKLFLKSINVHHGLIIMWITRDENYRKSTILIFKHTMDQ